MSPRLRQITESRAHSAFWKAIALQIVAIHLAFGTLALAHNLSAWGFLTAALTVPAVRHSWRLFRQASGTFRLLDR